MQVAQAAIATTKKRPGDLVIVTEKLDGSNVAIAQTTDGRIVPLVRAGYLAETSNYLQHHLFSDWVMASQARWAELLQPGESLSGEWLAQAHGTKYRLEHEPFVAFDWFDCQGRRKKYEQLETLTNSGVVLANCLSRGGPYSIEQALAALDNGGAHGALDEVEGAVWRVERIDSVEFLCKFVRPSKVNGQYLPGCCGNPDNAAPIWNEGLERWLPPKALRRLAP